jgi:probable HAF family extracellular repeat protein
MCGKIGNPLMLKNAASGLLSAIALFVLCAACSISSAQIRVNAGLPAVGPVDVPDGAGPAVSPRVVSVGPAQPGWIVDQTGLSTLEIRFDRDVAVPVGAVRITGLVSGPITPASQDFDPKTDVLTVDLGPAVQADIVTVVLDYAINSGGAALDGESGDPESASFPSGNGRPGGQTVFRYRILQGDVNRDGFVNVLDVNQLVNAIGTGPGDPGFNPGADLNGDGFINVLDVNILVVGLGGELPITDSVRPLVASIIPPAGELLVGDLSEVVVTFTEPVDSPDSRAVFVLDANDTLSSPASVSLAGDGMSANYTFDPPIAQCGEYTIAISPSLTDTSGELLVQTSPIEVSGITPARAPELDPIAAATRDATVLISGIAPDAASVEISSLVGVQVVDVTGDAFGTEIFLAPDRLNTISVTAITACGTRSAPRTTQIIRDNERPNVFIDFPADGAQIQAGTTDVAGRVSDRLSGFQGLTVMVNGQPAVVDIGIGTNGTFFIPAVPLNAMGTTEIVVQATDGLGNGRVRQIAVQRVEVPAGSPMMEIASGNAQQGMIHQVLEQTIGVQMTRSDGSPFSGKVVTFKVTRSNGRLGGSMADAITNGSLMYQVLTDSQGIARAHWRLGSDAGMGNNRVEVTSRDIAGTVIFCASATPGPADRILVGDMNNQRGEVGSPLRDPLRVYVTDGCNGVADTPVTYTVTRGDGVFDNGLQQITLSTDGTGHLDVPFTLGQTPGRNTVTATFEGNPGLPATFIATGIARNVDMPTTFLGTVLDNASRPLGNARLELFVNSQYVAEAFTDIDGNFIFTGVPDGPAHVVADGSTANTLAGESIPFNSFPFVGYDFTMVPNAENTLPQQILLPEKNPANQFTYDGTQDVELTVDGIEGLKFTVAAGTNVRLADGTLINGTNGNSILLTLDQVHFDDIPMPLPDGAAYPFAWTLQPKAATFDPPVAVELPNMAGLPAGAIGYILQWDGEVDEFVIAASGQVSEDGSLIKSDQGAGITVAGWGGACPPYPPIADIEKLDIDAFFDLPNGNRVDDQVVFWTNDDRDSDSDSIFGEDLEGGLLDSNDNFIRSVRDIEDLIPITIAVPSGMLDRVRDEGFSLRYSVSGDANVRFFTAADSPASLYRSVSPSQDQITGLRESALGGSRPYRTALAPNPELFREFTNADFDQAQVTLLVEAISPGSVEIRFNLRDGEFNEVATDAVVIVAQPIRSMYSQAYATPRSGIADPAVLNPAPVPSFGFIEIPPSAFDLGDGEGSLIFAHGFNYPETDESFLLEAETVLKRLWWSGFRGKFSAFRWPSIKQDLLRIENYNQSDYRAIKYAESLKRYVENRATSNSRVSVIAHSQGGLLAAEAVRLGAPVDTLMLLQSAVPSISFDRQLQFRSTNDDETAFVDEELANQTFDPLAVPESLDAGYPGRFENLSARVVNFAHSGDEVLRAAWGCQNLAKPAYGGPFDSGRVYTYNPTEEPGNRYRFIQTLNADVFVRPVTDTAEALGYINRSLTRAVGIDLGVSGSIDQTIDLKGLLDLGSSSFSIPVFGCDSPNPWDIADHGAHKARHMQLLWPMYERFVAEFGGAQPLGLGGNYPWTITLEGQSTQAEPSGTYRFAGIPANGQIVRVRGSRTGIDPRYFATDFFLLAEDGTVTPPEGEVSDQLFPSPISLSINTSLHVLEIGQVTQATTVARMSDGANDVPLQSIADGTRYSASAPAVASIDQDGLVTALDIGTAFITASNQGVSTVRRIDVVEMAVATTVQGFVVLPNGSPAVGAVVETNLGGLARTDDDGSFTIELGPLIPDAVVSVTATLEEIGRSFTGSSVPVDILPDAITDAGLVRLRLVGPLFPGAFYVNQVGDYPTGVALDDLNEDGNLDLVVANRNSGDVSVLLNGDNGIFIETRYSVPSRPESIVLGDIDLDGDVDMAVATGSSSFEGVVVRLNNGDGTFGQGITIQAGINPVGVSLGELNGDGNPDLVVANYSSDDVSVLLGNGDGTFLPAIRYAAGNGPGYVALGDLNGDGYSDMAVVNRLDNNVQVFLNNGDAIFTVDALYQVGNQPLGIALGDLDGDGYLDIVVANTGLFYTGQSVSVLLNDGNGNFANTENYIAGRGPTGVSLDDLDADGDLDIAIANIVDNNIGVLFNAGDGSFSPQKLHAAGGSPLYLSTGDISGDGKLDITVVNIDSNTVRSLINDGTGYFSSQAHYAAGDDPRFILVSSIDKNEYLDIVTVNGRSGDISILLGSAGGIFADQVRYPAGDEPRCVAVGDLDADGDVDLVVANAGQFSGGDISVLLNKGGSNFSAQTRYDAGRRPLGVSLGDLDGDGNLDMAVANSGSGDASVLLNTGDGTFAAETRYAAGDLPRSISLGDLDGDGDPDMVVVNGGSDDASVLLNNGDGTFAAPVFYTTGDLPISVSLGDLDGDGDLDMVAANGDSDDISVLLNTGNGTFGVHSRYAVGERPESVVLGDLDGDGDLDIAVANLNSEYTSVLLNTGDATFAAQIRHTAGDLPISVSLGDLDGDGYIDMAVSNSGSDDVSVLMNRTNRQPLEAQIFAGGGGDPRIALASTEHLDRFLSSPSLIGDDGRLAVRSLSVASIDRLESVSPQQSIRNAAGSTIARIRTVTGEIAAIRTLSGELISLGTLGGETSVALAINDAGQVVGWSETEDGSIHAFRYTPGIGMEDLGTHGGDFSVGMVLNQAGDTAGFSDTAEGLERPFLYTDTEGLRDLGSYRTDGGPTNTRAHAISPDGFMVAGLAESPDDRKRAIFWTEQTGVFDLNRLLPEDSPWHLLSVDTFESDTVLIGRGIFAGGEQAYRLEIEAANEDTSADKNRDRVDASELASFVTAFLAGDSASDINGDGVLDMLDLVEAAREASMSK